MKEVIVAFLVENIEYITELPWFEHVWQYKTMNMNVNPREWGRIKTEKTTFKFYAFPCAEKIDLDPDKNMEKYDLDIR